MAVDATLFLYFLPSPAGASLLDNCDRRAFFDQLK
jgi:hypothetical protein